MRKVHSLLTVIFLFVLTAFSQAPQPSTPDLEARVNSMLKQLTLEQKVDLIGGVDDFYIREIKQIGLPRLKMADGPIGVRNYGPSTTFGGIALAATWDTELARQVGMTIGQDARARGVHFVLGPGVNIYRAPMAGRNFEYFGEDPFLAARTAVAYIEGMQSQGVSATIKHFMGNNQEYSRRAMDSVIDERTMREIYLPTFEAAVKEAHVGAIMDSYNLTNGQHMTENSYLNNNVAKKEWGFQGIMMSDWDSTYDAVATANGGVDLEMPSGKFMNRANLIPAIKAGKVSEATIDDKVRRILRTAIQFRWLDRDQTDLSISHFNRSGDHVALQGARESIVLLKNERNLLPLDKTQIKSIAVIGPDAYPAQPVGGGSAAVQPFFAISYLQGLTNYFPSGGPTVYYAPGLPSFGEMADGTNFTTEANGGQPGLKAEFFNNLTLTGSPVLTSTVPHIHYDRGFGGGSPLNELSARWTGYFTPNTAGDYLVFAHGPDEQGGYRVMVDGKTVIDNWTRAIALLGQASVPLQPGPHKVEVEYFIEWTWGLTPHLNVGIVRPADLVSADAKAIAAKSDAVIVAVGFDPSTEGEAGDRTFQLPPAQDELVNQTAAANKNTIVVITSGGAVDMNAWLDHVPTLLQSWYSGQEAGTALAQLLFGDYSPSGKLPVSFERRWQDNAVYNSYYPKGDEKKVAYTEGVFLGYRHFDQSRIKPLFPFGFGLSYTTFQYKNLSVSPRSVSGDTAVTVSFDVTNTGHRAGAEVAQVYVGQPEATVPRPIKELKGFSKVALNPGETKRLSVTLDQRAFSYYDARNHRWTADPGEYIVTVGPSSTGLVLAGKVARTGLATAAH